MKKAKILSGALASVGIIMIALAFMIEQRDNSYENDVINVKEIDLSSMAASASKSTKKSTKKSSIDTETVTETLKDIKMQTVPSAVVVPPRVEVYEGQTIEELAARLDRHLGTGYMAGKGYVIASTCLEKGVDPYIALAIMLHETGCGSNCSKLVRTCNNVGGQKGSPGCNGGAYKAYATLDEGIVGFVNNLHKNYYAYGLTTVEAIAPKYAESSAWPGKINFYVNKIRNS